MRFLSTLLTLVLALATADPRSIKDMKDGPSLGFGAPDTLKKEDTEQ
jgi:hypothetical protein